MKRSAPVLLLVSCVLTSRAAFAARAARSPAHFRVRGHAVKLHVPRATVVELQSFRITVPAHWGFQARIEPKPVGSDEMTTDFITAPGNLLKSRIYVGVRERVDHLTIEQRRKILLGKKGHRSKTVHWSGQRWLLDEFQGAHPHTTAWTAYLVRDDHEYLILAECPNRKRPELEPKIFSVMKSMKLSPASQAPAK